MMLVFSFSLVFLSGVAVVVSKVPLNDDNEAVLCEDTVKIFEYGLRIDNESRILQFTDLEYRTVVFSNNFR